MKGKKHERNNQIDTKPIADGTNQVSGNGRAGCYRMERP